MLQTPDNNDIDVYLVELLGVTAMMCRLDYGINQ